MEIQRVETSAPKTDVDVLVVGLFADSPPAGAVADVDRATGGLLSRLVEQQELTGKPYELVPLLAPSGLSARQVLVTGLGRREQFDSGMAFRCASAAARQVAAKPRSKVAFFFDQCTTPELVEGAVCGALVGCHGQDLYRTEKARHPFATLIWPGGDEPTLTAARVQAESMLLTRRMVDQSPQDMYPEAFANEAIAIGQQCGLAVETWDEARLSSERCGALLAVAKGSSRPPRLVIVRYQGAGPRAPWLGIVGKGVTFDSGGLSLKTPEGMLTMKCDMAGAATMLGAVRAIALLRLPLNVVGLAGLVENMTGPAAMKLGDVLTARNGRTIEVHNTDAEGRLVLADVLAVAVDSGATRIVDLATLTGGCVVALGTEVAGLMTNDQAWCDTVAAAARACGEPVWQLPMYAEWYDEMIKSEVADIKNVGEGRSASPISGAKFLEQFVAGRPWTHIDIAGPAFRDKPKPWSDAGATGAYLRTLVRLARAWK